MDVQVLVHPQQHFNLICHLQTCRMTLKYDLLSCSLFICWQVHVAVLNSHFENTFIRINKYALIATLSHNYYELRPQEHPINVHFQCFLHCCCSFVPSFQARQSKISNPLHFIPYIQQSKHCMMHHSYYKTSFHYLIHSTLEQVTSHHV